MLHLPCFFSGFCGSAPNGCDGVNVTIFKIVIGGISLLHILYILYHKWWKKPSEIAPKVA
jgi:hypothetical protein